MRRKPLRSTSTLVLLIEIATPFDAEYARFCVKQYTPGVSIVVGTVTIDVQVAVSPAYAKRAGRSNAAHVAVSIL